MEKWEKALACAERCSTCDCKLDPNDRRILSIFSHGIICMDCKAVEEKRSDYENASKKMIANCLDKTNRPYGDPGGFCFHHFCPYKC